jgi:hypothetical protein
VAILIEYRFCSAFRVGSTFFAGLGAAMQGRLEQGLRLILLKGIVL